MGDSTEVRKMPWRPGRKRILAPHQTIHQKIDLQSSKRKLQSGGKRTFATSNWLYPEPALHVRDPSQGFLSLKWKPMRLAVAGTDGFLFTGKGIGLSKLR
jgi:hypothetical protein